MTNRVDDIISALKSEFVDQQLSKSSVMALDGEMVRIDRELWEKSPVLRAHASSGISHEVMKLAASRGVLEAMNKAHRDGVFPTGIRESYELLVVASELRLGELTSECLENLRTLNAFDESVDLPSELSVDVVMTVFNILLNGPLRTVEIYKCELSRIARHCANNRDVMTNAINSLKKRLEKFKSINLEGIPASFKVRTLPVVIYKRKGELQTAVIIGAEVRPVNLFGDRINLEDVKEDGFYLKYGVYLLYRCGRLVHYKYLLDNSEPREIFSDCDILLTKGNSVLAVQKDNYASSIFVWTDDREFEKIYQHGGKIERVEFDHNTRVLAVEVSESNIRLFRLENRTLFLLEEIHIPTLIDVCLSGRNMFILRFGRHETWIETHRLAAMSDGESSQSIDEQPAGKGSPNGVRRSLYYRQMSHVDGSYLLKDSSGLELVSNFPSLDKIRALMTRGELVALSELWMSP